MVPQVLKNRQGFIFISFKEGDKWLHAVSQEMPVRLVKFNADEEVNLEPALLHGKPYPVKRAAEMLLDYGKRCGMYEGAEAQLRALAADER